MTGMRRRAICASPVAAGRTGEHFSAAECKLLFRVVRAAGMALIVLRTQESEAWRGYRPLPSLLAFLGSVWSAAGSTTLPFGLRDAHPAVAPRTR